MHGFGHTRTWPSVRTFTSGASSRNGGQLLTGLKLDPATLVSRYGERHARQLFDISLESMARLETSGRRHLLKPFRVQDLTELVDQVLKDTAALCVPRRDRPSSLGAGA